MRIGMKHLQLVVLLRSNPRATLQELAGKLGVAPNTIRAWIDFLKEENLLRKDREIMDPILGRRTITERVAHPNPRKLGLTRVQVIFSEIRSYINLKRILKLLDSHPYTYFRAQGSCGSPAVFAQFDIPPSELPLLLELLKLVEGTGWCNATSVFNHPIHLETVDNFLKWNIDVFKWDFDFGQAFASFEPIVQSDPKSSEILIFKGDGLDLRLLRELSINAKIKATTLADHYSKDIATITRRLNRLRKQFISKETIVYNREKFNLNSISAFWGFLEDDLASKLTSFLSARQFPFSSQFSLNPEDGQFLWYVYAPSHIANQILKTLIPKTQFPYQMVIDPSTSFRYFFYPENFDTETQAWKGGVNYIVTEPFKQAENI